MGAEPVTWTIVDLPIVECDDCDLPNPYQYPQGTVIKCDDCGTHYVRDKFILWSPTDWRPEK